MNCFCLKWSSRFAHMPRGLVLVTGVTGFG